MNTHRDSMFRSLALIACLAASFPCRSLLAADVYVAPGGRDGNAGTKDAPLATVEAARDAVRQSIAKGMKENVTVHLAAGDYFIESPVVFDDRDSGRDGHTVTYQGAPRLGTRIYGGKRLTGWKKLNDREFEAQVPGLAQHYTLYENGRAANGGMFHVFADAPAGDWRKEGDRLIYHPRRLPIGDQVVVLGTTKDVFVVQGRSMEQTAENIVFDGLCLIGSDFASGWKQGATGHARWDGEYDGKPWGGRPLGDAVLAPDMRHGQFFVENARKIVIRNCRLYGAGFMAVMFNRWAQENRVENCWIENAGCVGIFFMGWECGRGPFRTVADSYVNRRNVVRNNVFHDIGRLAFDGAGIYLNFSGDNLVEHNVFHGMTRYGVAIKGWRPKLINAFFRYALLPDSQRNPRAEREFGASDVRFYEGYIVTEENQGAELSHSRNNVIRFNDLSQIARGGSDMGMIEMWGAGTGNVWEYNACHDGVQNGGWDEWMHCLFNDDGSHQATLRGNIMYWLAGGGRSRAIMCKGNKQLNLFNIIADSILAGAATIGPFVEAAHDMVWSHNIVAAEIQALYEGGRGEEKVGGVAHPILEQAEKNLYFYLPLGDREGSAESRTRVQRMLEGIMKGGKLEQGSVYADPMFDRKHPWWDARYTDYRLKPESPALRQGFQQTDMDQIGLMKGYPFELTEVFDHPAGETWKAANFSRIYRCHAAGEQVRPYATRALDKGAWTRYNNVDFGDGQHKMFRARLEWLTPKQAFETTIGGKTIRAMELGDSWCPIPFWEVSPVYTENGKKGPELIDVAFEPEKTPAAVQWTIVTEPLVSRATVKHPLGVINCDVANGENHANGAAYMRCSVYARRGGKTGIEIRGAHGVRVWLNGQQVFSQVGGVERSPRVEVTFKQGWNQFLVKVVQDDKPWAPDMRGWGNFWASVTLHYRAVGDAFIVPGLPGKEFFIQPNSGTAVEVRLDAPDGKRIGDLRFGQTTCEIEKTTGRHDLFLVFPNENVQTMDWFRFELAATASSAPAQLTASYAEHLRSTKGILDIRTFHRSGFGPSFLDVVAVSAGFRADEMGEFHRVCESFTNALLSKPPWQRYRGLVNIHAVFVGDESVDSSRLKVSGHKGGVLGCDNGLAVEYARYAANAAATVVIHNSGHSCGGTGVWGVATINKGQATDPMVPIHELGHGMAGLGDEYIQRNTPFTDGPKTLWNTVNVTPTANPKLCKWHYWTEEEWPGLFGPSKLLKGTKVANFEGAGWVKGLYRPEEGCFMRCNRDAFCAVCNETLEANFFRYVDLFQVAEPAGEEIVLWKGEHVSVRVSATPMLRDPPEWLKSRLCLYLDGDQVASSDRGDASFRLSQAALEPGIHELGANLDAQSQFVRQDFSFLSRNRGWRVKVIHCAKPKLAVPPRVSIPPDGVVDVPIEVKHEQPARFEVKMAHAPAGAVLEGRRFRWKPAGATGSWRVDFTASFEGEQAVTESMEIHVAQAKGGGDTIEVGPPDPTDAVTGNRMALQLRVNAKEGGHVLFEAMDAPAGMELNRYTGDLSWTPSISQAGPHLARFRVRNGLAAREFDVLFRVRRAASPSPVSYCNQYIPQTLAALKELKQSPIVYRRLFETLRLLRARYAQIYQPALADAKTLYGELGPKLRANCLQELRLQAWQFVNKPDILAWMREIAQSEKSEDARILLQRVGQIESYNANRTHR